MRNRAIRRHHRERIKRKRKRIFVDALGWDIEQLPILIDTPVRCSCICCGNRRKYEGPTRQEIRNSVTLSGDELLAGLDVWVGQYKENSLDDEFAEWEAMSNEDYWFMITGYDQI